MARSIWKGPFVEASLLKKVESVKTWSIKTVGRDDQIVLIGTNWNVSSIERVARKHHQHCHQSDRPIIVGHRGNPPIGPTRGRGRRIYARCPRPHGARPTPARRREYRPSGPSR